MKDEYKTIAFPTESVFKDKGSKFLAFAYPVSGEDEINLIRNQLKKKYHDASHHVYAFILDTENQIYRSSDDGEPSNSSGPPVLGQLRSFELVNVLIIVVRYFGGTKLGIPGLINAYRTAAHDALEKAKIIVKYPEVHLTLGFQYQSLNTIMNLVKAHRMTIEASDFNLNCSLKLSVPKSELKAVKEQLQKINSLTIISETYS
ncbi:MAG: YigZ family protein [Bacteroidales bacterium]